MRIAIFAYSFPLVSETFIIRQITGLLDLGHDVDVFAEERPPDDAPMHPEVTRHELIARTTYLDIPAESGRWELPVWPVWGASWPPGSPQPTSNARRMGHALPRMLRCALVAPRATWSVLRPSEYSYQASSLSALYRLSALCRRLARYDVVHAHFGPVANSFRFIRNLWRTPLIATFHGHDFSSWPKQAPPGAYQKLFNTADLITVNCKYARQRVEELGAPPHKLRQLNVGVDVSDYALKDRERPSDGLVRLLSVGRLVPKKGFEYAIRALNLLRHEHPAIRYDIVGEGPMRSELERLIHDLGLEGIVHLHGAQHSDVVRRMMSEADMLVLSSITAANGDQEGTPVTLMEAQASALPVVSTWHSGIPEVVLDGRTGFLVPERDVDMLAQRLHFLIASPELARAFGDAGRAHVEQHYDLRRLNRQLVELYAEAASEYRRSSR